MLTLHFENLLMAATELGPHRELRITAGRLHADGRVRAQFRAPYWQVQESLFTGYVCAGPVLACLESIDGERCASAAPANHHTMSGAIAYVGGAAFATYDVARASWRDAFGREWLALVLRAAPPPAADP